MHFTRTILLSGGKLVYSGRRRYLPDFFRESGCDLGAPGFGDSGTISPSTLSPISSPAGGGSPVGVDTTLNAHTHNALSPIGSPGGSDSGDDKQQKRENVNNVADRMMDWMTVKEHAEALSSAFLTSDFSTSLIAEIERGAKLTALSNARIAAHGEEIEIMDASDGTAPTSRSFLAQVRIVFRRECTSLWRSSGAFQLPVVCLCCTSIIYGATFYQVSAY